MLHVDLKLFFWVSEFFFFFYEFDLMTNGLSVYNGCQSRVSVETCAFEFLHFEFLDIHVSKIFLVLLTWEGLIAFV